MQAVDVMTTDVVSVGPETDVAEIARTLLNYRISAVPVVDHNGGVLGLVSEGDLLPRARGGSRQCWWLSLLANKTADFTHVYGTRARDVMTRRVISVGVDADVAELARTLETNAIKRVLVLDRGKLVGIVSRADILRGLATLASSGDRDARGSDREIRDRILRLLKDSAAVSLQAINIIVVNGAVHLWGIAETEEEQEAVRVAAENVVGPGKVRNNLNTLAETLRGIG